MSVLGKKMEVLEHRERRRRHDPKRGHRNIPAVPDADGPKQKRISHDNRRRQHNLVEEPLKRSFHLREDGFDERVHVSGANLLRWDNIRYGGEAYVFRLRVGADEAMKPSHSSVTTKVTRMSFFFKASILQRFIRGWMWPRLG
jgi:hypothetical protein